MIEILRTDCTDEIVAYRIYGRLTDADLDTAFEEYHRRHSASPAKKVLGIYDDFEVAKPMTFRAAVELQRDHFGEVERLAIVGDAPWLERAICFLQLTNIRWFHSREMHEARQWLK